MTEKVIFSKDIPNWDRCFNCIFAMKRHMNTYHCRIKTWLRNHREIADDDNVVFRNNRCDHFITRPKYATETYGAPVIIYPPVNQGVKKAMLREDYMDYHAIIRDRYPGYRAQLSLGFKWSFPSIRMYVLRRNHKMHGGSRRKYVCYECGKRTNRIEVHHILARSNGGSHTMANLKVLCYYCHSLETWKLSTGEDTIPDRILWRKAIEDRKKKWNDTWNTSPYKREMERCNKSIKALKYVDGEKMARGSDRTGYSVEEIRDERDKLIHEYESKLNAARDQSANIRRRLNFWQDQYDKSKIMLDDNKWKDHLNKRQYKTMDHFFTS